MTTTKKYITIAGIILVLIFWYSNTGIKTKDDGSSLEETEVIGIVKGSQEEIHRFVDDDTGKVCYFIKSKDGSKGLSCSDLPTSVYEDSDEKDINKDNEKLNIKISQKRLEI